MKPVVLASVICPSCSSTDVQLKGDIAPSCSFAGRRLSYELDGGRLYNCVKCHLLFRYPRHTTEVLNRLYRSGDVDSWSENESQRMDWRLIRNWLVSIEEIRRILDVGCFDGRFLEYLGRDYQRIGIEIHDKAATLARSRGVQIVGKDFESMPTLRPRADVATAIDVIEHSISPKQFLASMAACVEPGGYIAITTGNADATTWRFMGSSYWYCHIAEHLSFISPLWARTVSQQLGLEVQRIQMFSHLSGPTPIKQRFNEAFKNLMLKFAPHLFASLRRCGIGKTDLTRYPRMALSPPSWASSKDHMLIVFRKSARNIKQRCYPR